MIYPIRRCFCRFYRADILILTPAVHVPMAFGCLMKVYAGMSYLILVGTCHLKSIKIKFFSKRPLCTGV